MIKKGIKEKVANVLNVFLDPKSPAAIYKNPYPFFAQIYVTLYNKAIKPLGVFIKNVECIVCKNKNFDFGKMAAISENYIGNHYMCLSCNSNARTRTLLYSLKNILPASKKFTLLDIGPNESTKIFFKRLEGCEYKTFDKFGEADYSDDLENMKSINDNVFDFVMCIHVLEHIDDDKKAMSEIYRVLKKNGIALIMVPKIYGFKETRKSNVKPFEGYGHIWLYGDDFKQRLDDCGFNVNVVVNNDKEILEKYGLLKDEIFIAKKQ